VPNPASVILLYGYEICHRLCLGTALLALVLVIVTSCGSHTISEKGSRVDRVFVMANEGDATAQTALGLLYERGLGVSPNPATSLIWYRRAAKQGDALAMFHIGSLYERGAGVARDYVAAAKWYQRASDTGNASAQAALAYLYDRGLGVTRNFSEAEALYSRASAQWTETNKYPAEATFATGREVPALAGPSVEALPTYGGRPEFTAGKEEEPAIEIDLAALDEVPDPPPTALIFDGPEPIAGKGENFPLAGSSLEAPVSADVGEPAVLSVNEPLTDEGVADMNIEILSTDGTSTTTLEPLPAEPPASFVSLSTFETEALALAAWDKLRTTHAGLLARLPYELHPIDMGDEYRYVELIIGPFDSPTRSHSLCAALRAYNHSCRTIDR